MGVRETERNQFNVHLTNPNLITKIRLVALQEDFNICLMKWLKKLHVIRVVDREIF